MRKILITLVLLILLGAAVGATWILKGREISMFVDRHGFDPARSETIGSVRYEGNGTGGVLHVNDTLLSLNTVVPPVQMPSVGSTKDGQLGLAVGGKVFSLGPLPRGSDEPSDVLTTAPEPEDTAQLVTGHSKLSWPTIFDLNFMSGSSPSWKRHAYQKLSWTKPNGSKLEMLWRYDQNYDRVNGWTSPTMIHEGDSGLVKIEITP